MVYIAKQTELNVGLNVMHFQDSGNNSVDSNQITLRVLDRKDTNPTWTKEVFTIHIQEELKKVFNSIRL